MQYDSIKSYKLSAEELKISFDIYVGKKCYFGFDKLFMYKQRPNYTL